MSGATLVTRGHNCNRVAESIAAFLDVVGAAMAVSHGRRHRTRPVSRVPYPGFATPVGRHRSPEGGPWDRAFHPDGSPHVARSAP